MATKIKVVSGDQRPYVNFVLTQESDGAAIDLTDATVTGAFRAKGTAEVLSIIPVEIVDAAAGKCRHKFPDTTLNVVAGLYEGEVDIEFADGDHQTVFDPLVYQVREKFN